MINELYKKLGEDVFKNGNLVRNIFAPWNFIKFIVDYKKSMKALYQEAFSNIKKTIDNYDEENFRNAFEQIKMFENFWMTKKDKTYFNKIRYKVNLLDNIKSAEKCEFEPIQNRVCYCLNHSLPYRGDGYVTRSQHMAKALQEGGFDVFAITRPGFPFDSPKLTKKYKDIPYEEEIEGIKYRRQFADKKTVKSYKYTDFAVEAWKKTFLELKPQYVIAASNNFHALSVLIAAKELGIPFYYEVRGLWELTKVSRNPKYKDNISFYFEKYYEAKICNLADGVFTLTTALIDELEKRGVDRNKVYLLPNCANVSMFNAQERDEELANKLNIPKDVVTIGYLGTIQMYEGLDDLIEASAILKNKGIDFRLLFVGGLSNIDKKGYDKYLKQKAKEFGVDDKLIMPGKVPPTEVPKYYSLMDITPFGRKPLPVCEIVSPIKPLEAMAMKKTVIVSDLAALKEIVQDNVTGLYFQKGNVNSYAEVLEKAIRDENLRRTLGENARRWVEENRQWKNNSQVVKDVICKQ